MITESGNFDANLCCGLKKRKYRLEAGDDEDRIELTCNTVVPGKTMTGTSSMKTSTFSGAFAGAFDWVRDVVANNPARDCDWARRTALDNGARSIFH